ncbi:MAG: PilX N-terminal domain-containing pilus assembly protein [Methylococcaceae bacterium]|nr:PilX N-terminal domain-containing pilus assembly protein [Methylococcaceae bacterium]
MINQYLVKAKHQSGVVLVISLIMLLALTLIGVTSSSVTGLEAKMAANSKDVNLAFQSAEATLRSAEDYLKAKQPNFDRAGTNAAQGVGGLYTVLSTTVNSDGIRLPKDPAQLPPFYSIVDWYSTKVLTYGTDLVAIGKPLPPPLVGVAKQPVCIIEEIDSRPPASGGASGGVKSRGGGSYQQKSNPTDGNEMTYRITAHGWGSNTNSVATVQSVVKIIY